MQKTNSPFLLALGIDPCAIFYGIYNARVHRDMQRQRDFVAIRPTTEGSSIQIQQLLSSPTSWTFSIALFLPRPGPALFSSPGLACPGFFFAGRAL